MQNNFSRARSLRIPRPIGRLLLRRFVANEDGVYAIEFAFVALPFFTMLFMIFEVAFTIFANQLLDNGVADASRLIRTGQAQQQNFNATKFRAEICANIPGFFDCDNHLHVDVRKHSTFKVAAAASEPLSPDKNADGEDKRKIEPSKLQYDQGGASEIIVVRVYYEWPMITPITEELYADLSNGRRLLASAFAFRNEPFPW